jgi:hypothetical protein
LERTVTEDASAAIAQILNATVELLRRVAGGCGGQQTSGVDVEHLGETLVLASFLMGAHGVGMVPEDIALRKFCNRTNAERLMWSE